MGGGGSKPDAQNAGSSRYRVKRIELIHEDAMEQGPARFEKRDGIIFMPRGGYIVETESCGPVQFGIPPETVKDSLDGGISPPCYYVVVGEMFDRELGLSKAEFEFPCYFNFFCKQQRVKIVTDKKSMVKIERAFQETLFGPTWLKDDCLKIAQDFPDGTPPDELPRVWEEGVALDTARETMRLDSLVEFVHFDPASGRDVTLVSDIAEPATTNEIVKIRYKTTVKDSQAKFFFEVKEGRQKLAEVPDVIELHSRDEVKIADEIHAENIYSLNSAGTVVPAKIAKKDLILLKSIKPFEIPEFGVTMLGCSHGFDKNGKTTGFVLWINRKGIPPSSIESVILTHCHADHDAGTFQKILRERKINLITTRTIRDSFIRKYSAMTGFEPDFLNSLMHFHPVIIGEKMHYHLGELTFFYSLHTIPCIGFKAEYHGESIIYSGDTCFNPDKVQEMLSAAKIGHGRASQLKNFEWNHSVVLHEMGVPPIHTSGEQLRNACSVKANSKPKNGLVPLIDRLVVMHAKQGDAEANGLKHQGEEFMTLEFVIEHDDDTKRLTSEVNQALGLVSCLPWIRELQKLNICPNILALANKASHKVFKQGEVVIRHGDKVEHLFVVVSGLAESESIGDAMKSFSSEIETLFNIQSCIGEHSLLNELESDGAAEAPYSVIELKAHTEKLVKDVHKWLVEQGPEAKERVINWMQASLNSNNDPKLKCLASCSELYGILTDQMAVTAFLRIMNKSTFEEGASLNTMEKNPEFCFLVISGRVIVSVEDTTFRGTNSAQLDPHEVGVGMFIADINNLQRNKDSCMMLMATSKVECYVVRKKDIVEFTQEYPGVLVRLLDRYTIPQVNPQRFPGPDGPEQSWIVGHKRLLPKDHKEFLARFKNGRR